MEQFSVDIPNFNSEEWDEVSVFDTREEAIAFAQERFGADEQGRISLVTSYDHETDEAVV